MIEQILEGQARDLHLQLINYAAKNRGDASSLPARKIGQKYRVLLMSGERWLRRRERYLERKFWQREWERREADERLIRFEERQAKLATERAANNARAEVTRAAWREQLERCVYKPSYLFSLVKFTYSDNVDREKIHVRNPADVDRTLCGRNIRPRWYNLNDKGERLKEPQLCKESVGRFSDWNSCKVCFKSEAFPSTPTEYLWAYNKRIPRDLSYG